MKEANKCKCRSTTTRTETKDMLCKKRRSHRSAETAPCCSGWAFLLTTNYRPDGASTYRVRTRRLFLQTTDDRNRAFSSAKRAPLFALESIKPKGGLLVNTLFDFMSGVPFKVFLIASSLITHSIRGILTSVVSFAPFISVVVVQE